MKSGHLGAHYKTFHEVEHIICRKCNKKYVASHFKDHSCVQLDSMLDTRSAMHRYAVLKCSVCLKFCKLGDFIRHRHQCRNLYKVGLVCRKDSSCSPDIAQTETHNNRDKTDHKLSGSKKEIIQCQPTDSAGNHYVTCNHCHKLFKEQKYLEKHLSMKHPDIDQGKMADNGSLQKDFPLHGRSESHREIHPGIEQTLYEDTMGWKGRKLKDNIHENDPTVQGNEIKHDIFESDHDIKKEEICDNMEECDVYKNEGKIEYLVDNNQKADNTNNSEIECPMCQASYKNMTDYTHHLNVHLQSNKLTDTEVITYTRTGHKSTAVKLTPSSMYACNTCFQVFEHKLIFVNHTCINPKAKRVLPKNSECKICFQRYSDRIAFVKHVSTHAMEHTIETKTHFSCRECQKIFSSYHGFAEHAHFRYICAECGRGFSKKSLLLKHIEISHRVKDLSSTNKAFLCTLCDKECSSELNLTIHMKSHTGEHHVYHKR